MHVSSEVFKSQSTWICKLIYLCIKNNKAKKYEKCVVLKNQMNILPIQPRTPGTVDKESLVSIFLGPKALGTARGI